MFLRTIKRMQRAILPAVAVLLFSAILSLALCALDAMNRKELAEYESVCLTTPVTLTVTNLTGTQWDHLGAPVWVANVFDGDAFLPHSLKEYVKDLKVRASYPVDTVSIGEEQIEAQGMNIVGITSPVLAESAAGEQSLSWFPGFGEDILLTGERVCLLPASMIRDAAVPEQVRLEFSYIKWVDTDHYITLYYDLDLTVVGTHKGDAQNIYCPFPILKGIYQGLDQQTEIDCVSAVLADNTRQAEAVQHARYWFPEPDLSGTKIPWKYASYTYHPYALRVDDSRLLAAEEALQNSLTINRICVVLIFTLSVGAGLLIGFLMIRSRKHEIALMRTLGTPGRSIYAGLATEQMLCVLLGVILGGGAFFWQPAGQLLIFAGIYFAGLTVALLVFLRKNLLTTIKEDE